LTEVGEGCRIGKNWERTKRKAKRGTSMKKLIAFLKNLLAKLGKS